MIGILPLTGPSFFTLPLNMNCPILLLICFLCISACSETSQSSSDVTSPPPDTALLDTYVVDFSDIPRFWVAFDSATVAENKEAVFQRLYLDEASDGFKEFLSVRDFSPEGYANITTSFPRFWQSVRTNTLSFQEKQDEIVLLFNDFTSLYPAFKAPDVSFTIGNMMTGGTVSGDWILFGAELVSVDSTVDLSEFSEASPGTFEYWLYSVLSNPEDYLFTIAHEAVHFQQAERTDSTLLSQAIEEGAADFIAELVSGKPLRTNYYLYGIDHEEELWDSFKDDMYGTDADAWLYGGSITEVHPSDLGYFIGYRISQAYYEKQTDSLQAIKDIIEVTDYPGFLEKSGYGTLE